MLERLIVVECCGEGDLDDEEEEDKEHGCRFRLHITFELEWGGTKNPLNPQSILLFKNYRCMDSLAVIDAEAWLRKLTGTLPTTSVGWFRAGVGFYRKRYHNPAVTCLEKAVALDPINYEAWQVLARAYVLQNRRKDAIEALKKSVKLNNAADWQMLVELTNLEDKQSSS